MTAKKSIILVTFVVIASSLVCLAMARVYVEAEEVIDPNQDMLDMLENAVIVDLRDQASYDAGHIPGAINIPLNELGYKLYTLDSTKDIVVYCYTGQSCKIAVQVLKNAGFKDVYSLEGGIEAWEYPLETSDGRVSI